MIHECCFSYVLEPRPAPSRSGTHGTAGRSAVALAMAGRRGIPAPETVQRPIVVQESRKHMVKLHSEAVDNGGDDDDYGTKRTDKHEERYDDDDLEYCWHD